MAADRAAARYIAVEGPIGIGKTALARHLATELGSQLLANSTGTEEDDLIAFLESLPGTLPKLATPTLPK